jgi:hypothetical protein
MCSNSVRAFLVACALWLGPCAGPTLAAVTITNIAQANDDSGTADSLTVTGVTVAAPNMVIALVDEVVTANDTSSCGSLSDGTNSYTLLSSVKLNNSSADGIACFFYHYYASGGLSSGHLTYTFAGSCNFVSMTAAYISGSTSTPDSAVTHTASGQSASPSVTSAGTASVSNELVVGFAAAGDTQTVTQATGSWATPPNHATAPDPSYIAGSLTNTGTTAQTYNPSFSSTNNWGAIIAGFEPLASKPCTMAATGAGRC